MNKILSFILSFSALFAAPDSSGWVVLERPYSYVEEEMGVEDGVWAVFSKDLSSEKFNIRFPEEPTYVYSLDGMEVSASKDGEMFFLLVQPQNEFSSFESRVEEIQSAPDVVLVRAEKISPDVFEFLYQRDQKWVQERVFFGADYVYTLQVIGYELSIENGSIFFDSLYVER